MELSPIEKIKNIYFKREDAYKSLGGVNGTKLRQAEILVKKLYEKNPNIKGIVTACSIYSPQAPIVASVCKKLGLKCVICYGGTTIKQLTNKKMPILASKLGAEIQIIAKTGRHNVLYANIHKNFKDYGIIEYGMCVKEELPYMIDEISAQVQNIPDELDNLVVTCGSGFSSSSILKGIKKYGKKIKNIYLVHVAPNRVEKIKKNIGFFPENVKVVSLFERPKFKYEDELHIKFCGIEFHPKYEAKAFNWMMTESNIDFEKEKTLFWIIGREPKI